MEKRQNYSRKREAILSAICSTDIHPTADWIYQKLKPIYPDLSLGTVYRNLSQFKEEGIILSMGVINGQERFDANISPHSHFICNCCDAVIDIEETFENSEAAKQVNNKYGFTVEEQKIIFYGVCNQCKVRH